MLIGNTSNFDMTNAKFKLVSRLINVCLCNHYVANHTDDLQYRPFSHCIDQAGLGAFTVKSGRKHYNPPPLTVVYEL